ncbi:amino acid permease [Leuconostocaceae bacterium ESL0723]|nr:amino acid permease [Leuconostocaceae bacterium ESL0723]
MADITHNPDVNQDGTRRTLTNRHIQMIAIGGTIGTGLFVGSGTTISLAGPAILFLYALLGIVFFFMMRAIGEMLYAHPEEHTFVAFVTKYMGFGPGVFAGVTYWLGLIFCGMAELTGIAIIVQYWFPHWNAAIIQLCVLLFLVTLNIFAARVFGETEFWFAIIKIIAIVSLIVTGLFMVLVNFREPSGIHASFANVFKDFTMFPHGLKGFFGSISLVFFSLIAMEFVGITIGETKNPRPVLKKAINQIVYRILIFYIGSLFVIMSVMPWTSVIPGKSPFVQVFQIVGFTAAATVINFVVLTSATSALNSLIFSAGRHLYQISKEVELPIVKEVGKIAKNGIPIRGVVFSVILLLMAPVISSIPAVNDAFQFISAGANDLFIVVYIFTMLAHRKYRESSDFLPDGFTMPFYKIASPLTILAFFLAYLSLFTNENDVIPAFGAIVWVVVFGGICYLIYRKKDHN